MATCISSFCCNYSFNFYIQICLTFECRMEDEVDCQPQRRPSDFLPTTICSKFEIELYCVNSSKFS